MAKPYKVFDFSDEIITKPNTLTGIKVKHFIPQFPNNVCAPRTGLMVVTVTNRQVSSLANMSY